MGNMLSSLPGSAWNLVCEGIVKVTKPFVVKEFDEDDGWTERKIEASGYEYRVLEVNGWKPRQLLVKGEWVDVAGECEDLERLLMQEAMPV